MLTDGLFWYDDRLSPLCRTAGWPLCLNRKVDRLNCISFPNGPPKSESSSFLMLAAFGQVMFVSTLEGLQKKDGY